MPRDPVAESRRLHRAKRAAEVELRDTILCIADTGLSTASGHLARATLAQSVGQDAGPAIQHADRAISKARLLLRAYFDMVP